MNGLRCGRSSTLFVFAALVVVSILGFYIAGLPAWTRMNLIDQVASNSFNASAQLQTSDAATQPYRIAIVVVLQKEDQKIDYDIALNSLRCYVKRQPEHVFVLLYAPQPDERCPQKEFRFRRHCVLLDWWKRHPESEWVLVIDGDVGVANPEHRVEEWIERVPGSVELMFYERLYSWEIMAGGFLAKNTPYVRDFLQYWIDYDARLPQGYNNLDNGALHAVFLEKFVDADAHRNRCHHLWSEAKSVTDMYAYQACALYYIEQRMEGRTFDNGRIMYFPKGKGWARDAGLTGSRVAPSDFMFHGWKTSTMADPPPGTLLWILPYGEEIGARAITKWDPPFENTTALTDSKACVGGTAWRYRDGIAIDEATKWRMFSRHIRIVQRNYEKFLSELRLPYPPKSRA